jgi:Protein of unknown function (DUF1566)
LIWQGQTPAGTGLRANDQRKTNYDSTTALQKGVTGVGFVAPTQAEIDASTNSIGFKTSVNSTNLCGSNAWRLPTKNELSSLVKTTETPQIDNAWFPNVPPYCSYFTSSPSVVSEHLVWSVSFSSGTVYDYNYRDSHTSSVYDLGFCNLVSLVR